MPKTRPPFFSKIILVLILSAATSLASGAGDNDATNAPTPSAGTNAPGVTAPELDNYMAFPVPAPAGAGSQVTSNLTAATDTNSDGLAPEPGQFPTPAAETTADARPRNQALEFQDQLEKARQQRREKNPAQAANILAALLQANDAPPELMRPALFELALAAQDNNQPLKAQQVYAQYLHRFPEDPSVPEILLRQGMLYRQMGVTTLAISKFYAVMSSALKLKLGNVEYYKKLVLQAQIEIADTYYLEGKYTEASDFFNRLLKTEAPELNKTLVQFKLIRSLSSLTNHTETAARAQVFLELYPNSTEVPEVRFLLASALKKLGRNQESMKQVLLLLQSQQANVQKNPETWIYWQRRAGNEIASQLYKEGDYVNALEIDLSLADLDKSPAWQVPVWYQTALVYEQLQQWPKATDAYNRILARQKELTPDETTPSLLSLLDMAKWRKDYIDWMEKAKLTNQSFQRSDAGDPKPAVAQ